MKILYLDTPIDPPGGGQISLINIIKNARWQSALCIPPDCGKFYEDFISHQKDIQLYVAKTSQVFETIKKFSPDIVHSNSPATRYTFVGALASKFMKIPFVWHNRVIESVPLREKIISALSDRIIVISDAVGNKFKPNWIKNKLIKIYNAVDAINEFSPNKDTDKKLWLLKNYPGFSPEKKYKIVGVFSRMERWKGHHLFLNAFARITTDAQSSLIAILAGDGGAKNSVKSLSEKLSISDRIIFTGYQKNVAEIMNLCDVIVNPSVEPEPFGRTLIEAMACSKPVIATNIGGHKEIIINGTDGFLVEPEPEPMAETIKRIISNTELTRNVGTMARQKVIKFFTIEKQISEIEKLYKDILNL